MLTLVFRPLAPILPHGPEVDQIAFETADRLADLTQAQVITTVTPVLAPNGREAARHLSWHTFGSRNRLVVESTWHLDDRFVLLDDVRAAVDYHRFAAIWAITRQAGRAGFPWAATWCAGDEDPVLDNLSFQDAGELATKADPAMPPIGRKELPEGLVLEWLRPSVRIMKRLVYFAEDCKIDWESLIIEDLMTSTPATYLELREGRSTIALARVLRQSYLPGMEGYDPRSPRPPVEFEIESFEVHPEHRGKGYGALVVGEVQQLLRPVSTLDTYRRAEPFWAKMGFVRNSRRSSREDSNIFEWAPRLGVAIRSRTEDDD